jgi:hypothetical protein
MLLQGASALVPWVFRRYNRMLTEVKKNGGTRLAPEQRLIFASKLLRFFKAHAGIAGGGVSLNHESLLALQRSGKPILRTKTNLLL